MLKIQRRPPRQGNLQVWFSDGEIYIRESLDRGKDVQTVCLAPEELGKIVAMNKGEDVGQRGS